MFIEGLSAGSEVSLTARFGLKTVTLVSKVAGIYFPEDKKEISDFLEKMKLRFSKYIVVELFTFNGRPLSFDNADITCNIMGVHASKPYEWTEVKVFRINLGKYGSAHIVITDKDIQPFNRRGSFRVLLGNECYIRLKKEEYLHKAEIRDISSAGVGIIVPKSILMEPGDDVLITFTDYVMMFKPSKEKTPETKLERDRARFKKQISLIEAMNGGGPAEKQKQRVELVVKAVVVRIVDTIPRRVIGCKFLSINEELARYVNEKQMEKRRERAKRPT